MPYIRKELREVILRAEKFPGSSGELNYKLTMVCIDYLEKMGTSYNTMNDIVGALELAKHEFIRRKVNDYENEKIKENTDVY